MGLGNYTKQGWPDDDDYSRNASGGGGGGDGDGKLTEEERLFKFRFQIPEPAKNDLRPNKPATKRLLFLDGVPCRVHEHELYGVRNKLRHQGKTYTALCLTKNGIEKNCPLCDDLDDWPKWTAFFTVIDMGQVEFIGHGDVKLHHRFWTDSKGEKHYVPFERVLLAAKFGSEEKPGVARTLQTQAERRGDDLAGTVWDVTRNGRKMPKCGDTWEYVERVDLAEAAEYLRRLGANPGEMGDEWLQPVDYLNVLRPMSYNDMKYMIHGAADGGGHGARSEGAGWDGNRDSERTGGPGYQDQGGGPDDDDIPF